jgi:hypothetical protein
MRSPSVDEVSAAIERRYALLLAHRIPVTEIVVGRAYVIHARDGGVGVALRADGRLGYELHRQKFEAHLLDVEWDCAGRPHYGTAIPLVALDAVPPTDPLELLRWLIELEAEHQAIIDMAWKVALGESEVFDLGAGRPRP